MEDIDNIYSNINSINNNNTDCIGACYPANAIVKHPDTGNIITSNENFCPIKARVSGADNKLVETTKCFNITYNANKYNNMISGELNYINFLDIIYNIKSFYDAISYINKYNPNIFTEDRIINMSWAAFAYDNDNIPNIVYDYYKKKLIKIWDPIYRKKLAKDNKNMDKYPQLIHNVEKNIKNIIDRIFTQRFGHAKYGMEMDKYFSKKNMDQYINMRIFHNIKINL